jgi:hypothetical protein
MIVVPQAARVRNWEIVIYKPSRCDVVNQELWQARKSSGGKVNDWPALLPVAGSTLTFARSNTRYFGGGSPPARLVKLSACVEV